MDYAWLFLPVSCLPLTLWIISSNAADSLSKMRWRLGLLGLASCFNQRGPLSWVFSRDKIPTNCLHKLTILVHTKGRVLWVQVVMISLQHVTAQFRCNIISTFVYMHLHSNVPWVLQKRIKLPLYYVNLWPCVERLVGRMKEKSTSSNNSSIVFVEILIRQRRGRGCLKKKKSHVNGVFDFRHVWSFTRMALKSSLLSSMPRVRTTGTGFRRQILFRLLGMTSKPPQPHVLVSSDQ